MNNLYKVYRDNNPNVTNRKNGWMKRNLIIITTALGLVVIVLCAVYATLGLVTNGGIR
tara:strand:- start:19163 stop:19336 length:174 start_codon:yes stop_codon:yes gene_type:complete